MSDGERRIVIVKKAKRVKAGGHGGSWKVAYADFVTAMMAFFLVMWIMGMDEGVREMVEGYFSNPVGFRQSFSGGTNPMSAGNAPIPLEVRNYMLLTRSEQTESFRDAMSEMSAEIQAALDDGELSADVEMTVSDGGLRIEIMERAGGDAFFELGSAEIKESLRAVLRTVVDELAALPNAVILEGHTDGRGFQRSGYGNWELSSDRAHAARRALVGFGLADDRIVEVRGYADRRLKRPELPFAPENRRISLLLPYQDDLIRRPAASAAVSAGGGGSSPSAADSTSGSS